MSALLLRRLVRLQSHYRFFTTTSSSTSSSSSQQPSSSSSTSASSSTSRRAPPRPIASIEEQIRRKYEKELIRRLQEKEIVDDEDLRRRDAELAEMSEFRAVEDHLDEVVLDPETYSAPPRPLAPLEEREAAKRRILNDVVVVGGLDPTSPPFREAFADDHPADVLTMIKHAHGTLSGYENPNDYVVEFVTNADGDAVDYQIVPREGMPPEQLDRVLDKYRGDDLLPDVTARIPDGPKKHAIVDAVNAAAVAEVEDDDEIDVTETDDGYKFVSSDIGYQRAQADALVDSQLVEIGSSNTALDSQFKPPEYGDMAADSAYKVMQARRVVFEESPELLAARRDIMFARHKLHKHYRNEMTDVSEIKAEAIDTLLRWGAPEPLLPNELRIIEESLVRMHVDIHARTPETRQLGAQSAAIFLKYNPVRRGVAEATRINPMQECADRLSAMLPVRAAPKGAAAWSDVLHALLTHTGNPALAEGFVARLAASPPPNAQLHWSAQDVFTFRITEHHWCTINFRVGVVQIADLNPAHGERDDLPLIREGSAPITVDWAVALKKVRWPASESPPRLLD